MSERKANLFDKFKKASKEDWAREATASLKNEDVFEKFNWQLEEGITLEPYYDENDLGSIEGGGAFQNRLLLKQNPTGEPRYWENIQKIPVADPIAANKLAIEALNHGADGLIFDIRGIKNVSFDQLLYDILIDYCSISFIMDKDYLPQLLAYSHYIENKNIDPLSVAGIISLNKESLSNQDYLEMFRATINYPGLKLGLTGSHSDLTEQIAQALSNAVGIIEHLSAAEFDIEQSVSKIAFTIPVSTNYFGEIAKVRALRNLYFQLVRAYAFDNFKPEDVHIQCISTTWNKEKYQPHANMLKSTTAAMAAILGGCDSLLIEPEDIENPLMRRIARNVSNILKEESYFNKTSDPVAGAYYLEVLVDKLSQKAWKLFQTIVNEKKEELHQ